ncbi:MAG: molecular chaperone TorD family protein [Dehalococcoidia bacterium]|nr:molecular chaperone TorD family protein [Dehalococcoidia bacterium]
MLSEEMKEICRLFAEVMDYPDRGRTAAATACALRLQESFPDATEPMRSFAAFVESQSTGALEELYAGTFDNTPATTLYVGYHLFGDGAKRSAFLVKLEEAYLAYGFSHDTELADHLCVLLRFLSVGRDVGFAIPLLEECMLPIFEKVEEALRKTRNPYHQAARSLRLFLRPVLSEMSKRRMPV